MSNSKRILARLPQEDLDRFDAFSQDEKIIIYYNLGSEDFELIYGKERRMAIQMIPGVVAGQAKLAPKLGDGIYKDGNPKTQFGAVKPGTFETPPIPLYEYSLAHTQGALKYGHYNWRDDPVSISTYVDAAKRHIDLYVAGQKNASDTGIHNLAHGMCCLSIIIDAEAHDTLIDDRKLSIRHEIPTGDEVGTDDILERYFEEGKKRVLAIKEQWTGHAEAVRNKTLDEWKRKKALYGDAK